MAARKSTRKAAGKKKATPKKATRKKAAKKKTARKKKAARRSTIDLVGSELPKSLKAFGRQCRRDLSAIEKQIEIAGKDTRRSLTRIVRDVSHQLGTFEARGEREWRKLSRNAKRDIERVIRRVRKATSG
jgi:hypothetical protein